MIFVTLLIFNIFIIFFFNKLSKFINLFDIPDGKRKFHLQPTPSIGGFIIFFNLLIFFFFEQYKFFYLNEITNNSDNKDFIFFFIFLSLFFIVGFLDDKFNLNANFKLFCFLLVILFFFTLSENLLLTNLQFSFFKNPIDVSLITYPFSILCIILFLNAFNMFDGINLQSSFYSISIFFIFIINNIFLDISIIMIISLIFFSYLNFKNKCFLGNNGALLIAFIISYLFIKAHNVDKFFFADQIFLIMQIPGLDLIRLAIQRIYQKKNPFHPDRDHIHHILLKKFGYKKTLLILNSMFVIPNYLSIIYGHFLFYIILTFFIYCFVIFKFRNINSNY